VSPAAAEAETLTIRGDGVGQEIVFTLSDLEAIDQELHTYSVINNFPTESVVFAKGVPLEYLLERAGLKDTAQLLTFTASDGFNRTLTVSELLAPRFYFPESGAPVAVPAMVCLQYSSYGLDALEPTVLRLIMGQRARSEQNNPWFVRFLATIDVSTEAPERWPEVTFETSAGPDAVLLHLRHENFDSVKIYYTTDGSPPTVESAMYNVSATRFQPELNKPLEIDENTTVRAIAIGPGRTNSAESSITISFDGPMFEDLGGYDWAKAAIEALAAMDIVNGIGNNRFDPGGSLTRAMFVTMLSRALNEGSATSPDESAFSDVDSSTWYGAHVQWAVDNNIARGYEDGTFRPMGLLTVEEMIVMAVRAGFPGEAQNTDTGASQITGVSGWALPYVIVAEKHDMLPRDILSTETAGGIAVEGRRQATRAEAAVIVFELMS